MNIAAPAGATRRTIAAGTGTATNVIRRMTAVPALAGNRDHAQPRKYWKPPRYQPGKSASKEGEAVQTGD